MFLVFSLIKKKQSKLVFVMAYISLTKNRYSYASVRIFHPLPNAFQHCASVIIPYIYYYIINI